MDIPSLSRLRALCGALDGLVAQPQSQMDSVTSRRQLLQEILVRRRTPRLVNFLSRNSSSFLRFSTVRPLALHAKLERPRGLRRGRVFDFECVTGWVQGEFDGVDNRQERESDLDLGEIAAQAAMDSQAEGGKGARLHVLRPFRREPVAIEALRFRIALGQTAGHGIADNDPRSVRARCSRQKAQVSCTLEIVHAVLARTYHMGLE